MIKHPEDIDILTLFMQGGSKTNTAFNQLVAKYGEVLYRQIRAVTKNHEHTNDVLQDVLIKVYQNIPKFKGDSALYTWLYRIARNESLNFLEKENRRSGVDIDAPTLEIIAGHALMDTLDEARISDLLQRAIATLPEKQAAVFQLKYFEELKYSEIAAQLSTSEGALKASFFHAKQKIEEFILSELNQSPI